MRIQNDNGRNHIRDYKNLLLLWSADRKSVRVLLFGITRLCQEIPNSDPEGRIFLSAPNTYDRFFFLHTFWSPAFDFNIGVAINEFRSYMLTSTILTVDVACDVAMTSTPNVLTIEIYMTSYTTNVLTTRGVIQFLSIPWVGQGM